MIEAQLKDLVTRDVDGLLSVGEQSQLARSLRKNKAARTVHAAHRGLAATLANVRDVEPPVHLAHRIRHAVHAGEPVRSSGARRGLSIVGIFRYGGVFAGGLAAGALFFFLLVQSPPVESVDTSAAGSFAPRSETIPVNVGDVAGAVTVARRPGVNEISLRLTVPHGVVARLDFDPSRVAVESVRGVETIGGSLVIKEGRIEFTGSTRPSGTLILVPDGAEGTVAFSLRSGDIEFFRRPIPLTR
jgi:anti-sigma factor RsiW